MEFLPVGYTEWPAPEVLRPAVACLWSSFIRPDGSTGRQRLVVPDGCSDLIWEQGVGISVAGPDTGPVTVTVRAGTVIIGLRFRPWAGGPMLGLPLSELRDQRVDLTEVRRADAAKIPATLTPELAVTALTDLAGRLIADNSLDGIVVEAARLLLDPRKKVEQVADETAISLRQLRRRCDAAVGYGPKTLQRIMRFQRFMRRIDAGADDLAAVAADAGYADQAHLTRECVQLAGLTPAVLATVRRDAG